METSTPVFTVFTPTHNRAHLLHKLYDCLKKQSYRDFMWLVIDDGSSDNTAEVIKSFQKESIIKIEYRFIENGFLHKAMKLSSEIVYTKYIVRIDDDDELTPDCLETFYKEWQKIESEGKKDIGEIRALSILDNGKIAGNYQPTIGQTSIDTTYLERSMNEKNHLENVSCRKVEIWKQLFHDDNKWLYDKVTYISDSIFWNRLSRLCKTRYIFVGLRLFHDTPSSTTKRQIQQTRHSQYNKVFSRYVSLNELRDYYKRKPWFFFKETCIYGIYAFALNLNFKKVYTTLESNYTRMVLLLLSPILYLYSFLVRTSKE